MLGIPEGWKEKLAGFTTDIPTSSFCWFTHLSPHRKNMPKKNKVNILNYTHVCENLVVSRMLKLLGGDPCYLQELLCQLVKKL